MPGEYSARIGRDFVNSVSSFFQDNFGFSVDRTAYEGPAGASIVVDGERIRFDMINSQTRTRTSPNQSTTPFKVRFFCECKYRSNPSGLKRELKKFLEKAMKASPELQIQFSDSYGFMFICNQRFGVKQSDLENVEYLRELLDNDYKDNDLKNLTTRTMIVVLEDWFLELLSKGRI